MGNRRVNSITYGAIICALVGALLLINRQMANFLDVYLFWIIPLPVIVYAIKFGTRQTCIMAVAMVLTSLITTGFQVTTIFYVVGAVIAGLVYGYGVNHKKSATFLILSVVVVSLIMAILTTFVFSAAFGYNVADEIEYTHKAIVEMLQKAGLDPSAPAYSQYLNYQTLLQIFAISIVLTSLMEGVLVHMLAYLVLRRLKMTLPPMKPIATIYAPWWIKLFVFVAFFAFMAAKFTKITQYDNIITPLLVVAQVICYFFGYLLMITLATAILQDRRKVMLLSTVVVMLFFFTASILVILGIFDIFSGVRQKIMERGMSNAQPNGQG
ncbi:MAG: DUF2232 domain-containing protein [Erysipelotrichaceae bacterium]|nr:DUF2232 domain-containing protein [Erysipelotrichaceae bacterium]MBO4538172.1 DUF2232 domain-containing protein [Erysipelotrichaceae bacterium]MBR5049219.1 DUF2232 domain-containing protein [Erysipelotrichaceae bacterium]